MSVERGDVERVAKLARLALTTKEMEQYRVDLEVILDYVSQIRSANTDGGSDELDPDRTEAVFREDEVKPGLTQEQALKNAPDTDGQYFRVPPMLPGESH